MIQGFSDWLEHRPFAIAIAESTWMFPITETIHVLTLSVGGDGALDRFRLR
jgi:hypothetical protein